MTDLDDEILYFKRRILSKKYLGESFKPSTTQESWIFEKICQTKKFNKGFPQKVKAFQYRRQYYLEDRYHTTIECFYCGLNVLKKSITRDHLKPRSKGYPLTPENCVLCCHWCNQRKKDFFLDEWLSFEYFHDFYFFSQLYPRVCHLLSLPASLLSLPASPKPLDALENALDTKEIKT
jgi:hypothetical protein